MLLYFWRKKEEILQSADKNYCKSLKFTFFHILLWFSIFLSILSTILNTFHYFTRSDYLEKTLKNESSGELLVQFRTRKLLRIYSSGIWRTLRVTFMNRNNSRRGECHLIAKAFFIIKLDSDWTLIYQVRQQFWFNDLKTARKCCNTSGSYLTNTNSVTTRKKIAVKFLFLAVDKTCSRTANKFKFS